MVKISLRAWNNFHFGMDLIYLVKYKKKCTSENSVCLRGEPSSNGAIYIYIKLLH